MQHIDCHLPSIRREREQRVYCANGVFGWRGLVVFHFEVNTIPFWYFLIKTAFRCTVELPRDTVRGLTVVPETEAKRDAKLSDSLLTRQNPSRFHIYSRRSIDLDFGGGDHSDSDRE